MAFLAGWVTNIILFILLAIIVDMLLPNSSMQKYVKMVVGLLLIVIILKPIFTLFSTDLDEAISKFKYAPTSEEKNIENVIEMKKTEIQASTRAYIVETMAVQIETQVEEELMREGYDYYVLDVNIDTSDNTKEIFAYDDITSIEVVLANETADEPEGIPVVKSIEIDTSKQIEAENHEMDVSEIQMMLAKELEIDSEKIVVTVEGGKKS